MYQNHLDRTAAVREKQGKDGTWLKDHFQQKLGFTNTEFAPVRAAALDLEPKLQAINLQAMQLARQDRAWLQLKGGRSSGPPPGHQQMQQLRKDRDALIQQEIEGMNKSLGTVQAAKLQYFLENEFAPHVRLKKITPGQPHSMVKPSPSSQHPWPEVQR